MGRISHPQYLLLALRLLWAPLQSSSTAGEGAAGVQQLEWEQAGGFNLPGVQLAEQYGEWVYLQVPSWPWWCLRATLVQQRLLGGRSAELRQRLLDLTGATLKRFPPPSASQRTQQGEQHDNTIGRLLSAAALLEAALVEHVYGHVTSAAAYLRQSCEAAGFHAQLTGAPCSAPLICYFYQTE